MMVSKAGMACLSFHIIPVNTSSVAFWNSKPTAEFQTLKKVVQIENRNSAARLELCEVCFVLFFL